MSRTYLYFAQLDWLGCTEEESIRYHMELSEYMDEEDPPEFPEIIHTVMDVFNGPHDYSETERSFARHIMHNWAQRVKFEYHDQRDASLAKLDKRERSVPALAWELVVPVSFWE